MYLLHRRTLKHAHPSPRGDISMSEYNIDDITKLSNDENYYYPKRIFTDLVPSLVKFIKFDVSYKLKAKYCFGVKQDDIYQNPHDCQTIRKEIEIVVEFDTEEHVIENLLLNRINDIEDRRYSFDIEVCECDHGRGKGKGVTLTVVSIELFKDDYDDNKDEYDVNVYREDVCVVCMTNKPDILFCNCGHLIVCDECYHELDKCPKCRLENDIVRKI